MFRGIFWISHFVISSDLICFLVEICPQQQTRKTDVCILNTASENHITYLQQQQQRKKKMSMTEDTNNRSSCSGSPSIIAQNKRKLGVDFELPLKKIKYQLLEKNSAATADNVPVSPVFGTPVDRREFRRAGPYILGPKIGHSPVESIVQYLAKKDGTDEFVQLKVRTV